MDGIRYAMRTGPDEVCESALDFNENGEFISCKINPEGASFTAIYFCYSS